MQDEEDELFRDHVQAAKAARNTRDLDDGIDPETGEVVDWDKLYERCVQYDEESSILKAELAKLDGGGNSDEEAGPVEFTAEVLDDTGPPRKYRGPIKIDPEEEEEEEQRSAPASKAASVLLDWEDVDELAGLERLGPLRPCGRGDAPATIEPLD